MNAIARIYFGFEPDESMLHSRMVPTESFSEASVLVKQNKQIKQARKARLQKNNFFRTAGFGSLDIPIVTDQL